MSVAAILRSIAYGPNAVPAASSGSPSRAPTSRSRGSTSRRIWSTTSTSASTDSCVTACSAKDRAKLALVAVDSTSCARPTSPATRVISSREKRRSSSLRKMSTVWLLTGRESSGKMWGKAPDHFCPRAVLGTCSVMRGTALAAPDASACARPCPPIGDHERVARACVRRSPFGRRSPASPRGHGRRSSHSRRGAPRVRRSFRRTVPAVRVDAPARYSVRAARFGISRIRVQYSMRASSSMCTRPP